MAFGRQDVQQQPLRITPVDTAGISGDSLQFLILTTGESFKFFEVRARGTFSRLMKVEKCELLKLEHQINGHNFKESNSIVDQDENCFRSEGKYFQTLTNSYSEFIMYYI